MNQQVELKMVEVKTTSKKSVFNFTNDNIEWAKWTWNPVTGCKFGPWIANDWIEKVLNVARENPQWNYLFLTKNPKRLIGIDFPDNAWVGTS
jgi:protein gp37